MKKSGGPFGGGGIPGGGKPFGGKGGTGGKFPPLTDRIIKVDAEVIPGAGGRPGDTRRSVVPGAGGHVAPASVVPAKGRDETPIFTEEEILGPIFPVIHVTVFARYSRPEGEQLIKDIGYLNAASGQDFHLVLAGYSREKPPESATALSGPRAIELRKGVTWYYDDVEFDRQVRMVEKATTWKYAGGLQLLICDVSVAGRRAANTAEMFEDGKASLENVIVVDVDELKDSKLFADFERFFAALRTLIHDIQAKHADRLTWRLSDRLALTKSGVAMKAVIQAFKLDFDEAWDSAKTLKSFAVRDLRKDR